MLNREDFFAKFTSVCPGSLANGSYQLVIDSDIYFEPLSMDGLEEMHRYSKDERLYEFLEFEPFDTIDKTRTYIEKLKHRMAGDPLSKTAVCWFVRRKADNYLVGTAVLISLDFGRQSIEWGYGVDPELWGHGYILQIQEILKQHVFEVLELNRLYGVTMITNQRTISSLLSCGMRNEGVSREFYCKNGAYIDGWRYAMLRNDYFRTKELPLPLDCMCTIDDVVNIVQSVLTEEKITHESTMRTVMSWDSLNHMSIMIAVTEKTGVSLSPSEMMRANSVATLRSILANRGGRN